MHHTLRNVRHAPIGQVGSRRSGPLNFGPASSRKHGGPPVHASRFPNPLYQAGKTAIVSADRWSRNPVLAAIQMRDLDEKELLGVKRGKARGKRGTAPHAAAGPMPRKAGDHDAARAS